MAFMKELIKQNIPIWEECMATPFLRELRTGRLPAEKFKHYMMQDSIYLKNYARIYGMAIYRSEHLKDIQMFYSMLRFVTDEESLIRRSYLKQFGLTDADMEDRKPWPENQNYLDFLFDIAGQGNVCEMLMAVLPCMLSYSYIFRKMAAAPDSVGTKYADFIWDYADEGYARECWEWCGFAEQKCCALSRTKQKAASAIFEKASRLELDFWNMAYRE